MTNMRLTTLNLDQECLDLLGSKPNKSAHVRHVLKNHQKLAEEHNHIEDLLIQNRIWYSILRNAIVEAYHSGWTVEALLTDLCDETDLAISKYAEHGHLDGVIRGGVARRESA